jgi:hypothetical protein
VSGSGNASAVAADPGRDDRRRRRRRHLPAQPGDARRFSSFAQHHVGRADGTGDLSFGNLVLPTNLAVLSNSGDVDFTGTVASAAGQGRNLGVTTGGTTTFAAPWAARSAARARSAT